jgi:hypothetical protein
MCIIVVVFIVLDKYGRSWCTLQATLNIITTTEIIEMIKLIEITFLNG